MKENEFRQPEDMIVGESQRIAARLLVDRDTDHPDEERVRCLQKIVTQYENHFGISSNDVHDAIQNKTLVETEEVCDWIMANDLLRRIQGR
jgi:hypothetical protein